VQASEKDERDEKFTASFSARGNSLWPQSSGEEMGAETNFYEILCFLAVKSFFAVIALPGGRTKIYGNLK
jgi:hypothetical protein